MKTFAVLWLFLLFASVCFAIRTLSLDNVAVQNWLQDLAAAQRQDREITRERRLVLAQDISLSGTLMTISFWAYRNLLPMAEFMARVYLDECPDILFHYRYCIAINSVSLFYHLIFPMTSYFLFKRPISKKNQFSGIAAALELLVLCYLFSIVGEESAIDGANLMFAGLSNLAVAGLTFIVTMASLAGEFLG